MSGRGSAVTLSRHAYEQIRNEILSGRLAPGQPLRVAALTAQIGVSMSVVREALTRLSEQGLVIASPNQGFRVIPLSEDDLVDLTGLRVTLECSALERSIDRGDVNWEALVVSTHHVLERSPAPSSGLGERERWTAAHADFHDALSSACGSPRLLGMVRQLRGSAEIYRQWSGAPGVLRGRDVAGEHRMIMELATARRAPEAVSALREHIESTTRLVLESRTPPAESPGS
ncbi:GntR family transcriptional regulator [Lentzea sp. HUAS12]|uniref:GntR family transcriptional regulator n=1 Tax=Lentzea sp. HUAS12 TaxID=2951806 RepID=UPI00209CA20B|nr:GntR family transcriptional regulator [Lentzea sp. HUAS12]USX56296.1 GntR family transcriptional regulator [Lentzea sp. HUAS12]